MQFLLGYAEINIQLVNFEGIVLMISKKVFLQKTFHRFYMGDHSYMQLMKFEITQIT